MAFKLADNKTKSVNPLARFKLSPSVAASLSGGNEVSASAIVNNILKLHPDYARSIHLKESSNYLKRGEEWAANVRSLYDYKKVEELHGKLFVVGLCMLDKGLEKS